MKKEIEVIVLGEKIALTKKEDFHERFRDNYYEDYIPMEKCTTIEIKKDNIIKSRKLRINIIPSRKFSSINKNFVRSANIALLMFDVTNIESFINLYDWNELLLENENLIKCVIANKNHVIKGRISEEDGQKFAKKIGAFYYEICDFNNEDINDVLSKIMKIYSESYEEIHINSIYLKEEKKEEKGCCKEGGFFDDFDVDNSGILYHLKLTNSKKEKNDIINENKNEDNKNNDEKEIIKYKNGSTKEILGGNPNKSIFHFNNGVTFKGEMNENNNFITGHLKFEDSDGIDIYNKKIVNLINALLYVNNPEILKLYNDSEEEYYTLYNNFVIKTKFVFEKMVLDDYMLNDKDLILFIYDKFEKDFPIKFKSLYNQIIKENNEEITIGIIAYNNNSKNPEIEELATTLNIFYEELKEKIEIEDFLKNIKNKYLNHLKNKLLEIKVLEKNDGIFYGDFENDKKEGNGIMLYDEGEIYLGSWKYDAYNGEGIFINGLNIKFGEFKNNELFSGESFSIEEGYFKINNGIIVENSDLLKFRKFSGTMMDESNLYGKLEIKNGNIYEGKFELLRNENGTIFYKNGDIYKGEWKDYKKNGKGIMYTNDGIKIEAEWEDDVLIKNNIQIVNKNGDIFIGEVCEEENIEDENIDFKFEKNNKIYNFEEKLNIIDNYFSGAASKFEDLEEYDEDIGKEVYNINDIYHLWKIGKQKWENQKKKY